MIFLPEEVDKNGNVLCLICKNGHFTYGARGGETQNIECCECGAKWNYGRLGMEPINTQAEKILIRN